jgi:hypothetical protein
MINTIVLDLIHKAIVMNKLKYLPLRMLQIAAVPAA